MAEPVLLHIHTDGASRGNPGPAAYAYVIQRDGEEPIEEAGRIGRMTNNQAEYTALVRALEHALELGAEHRVLVHSDSELLVKQMRGEYRVKNEDLRDLYEEARALSGRFRGGVTFRHVRREENARADALGNEALDGLREPTPRASNTPRAAAPAVKSAPPRSVRERGLACLRRAAAAWAKGAAAPTPEQVWDELLGLMPKQGGS
ncbi:MAG TPA: ribonuclease HI family protein [Gemmataceae bacterium]|nr:ribonuclease HI family protein [Gemmataceae bacterium]